MQKSDRPKRHLTNDKLGPRLQLYTAIGKCAGVFPASSKSNIICKKRLNEL